jgi:uncharacterized protein YcaQ
VYLPAEKRKIVYYNLAIIYQQTWYGQVDVKAERSGKVLLLQNLVLHPRVELTDEFGQALCQAFNKYAAFNGCADYQLVRASPEVRTWFDDMLRQSGR